MYLIILRPEELIDAGCPCPKLEGNCQECLPAILLAPPPSPISPLFRDSLLLTKERVALVCGKGSLASIGREDVCPPPSVIGTFVSPS